MIEKRHRLALELHDVVSQKLFSVVLTAEAAGTLLERGDPAAAERLARTARELEVLAHIGGGLSNKRIARALGISESTVKAHVGHVLAKLGVADRTQAALHAQRSGLV